LAISCQLPTVSLFQSVATRHKRDLEDWDTVSVGLHQKNANGTQNTPFQHPQQLKSGVRQYRLGEGDDRQSTRWWKMTAIDRLCLKTHRRAEIAERTQRIDRFLGYSLRFPLRSLRLR